MAASKKRKAGKAAASAGGRIATRGFGGAATAATGARPLQSGAYAALSRYLLAGGADARRVAIADIPTGGGGGGPPRRGVIATEAVPAGAVLCTLPRGLAVDLGTEGANPGLVALELLRLMDAAAGGSRTPTPRGRSLGPVFECLPPLGSAEVLTPDWYTAAEVAAVEYAPVVAEVTARQRLLRQTYEEAAAGGVVADRLARMGGYERYLWAVFIVVSRSYTIAEASGAPPRKYLLPLFDMANHDPASPHTMTCRDGVFQLLAGAPVAAGEEVCLVYGGSAMLGNDRLLMDYGFVNADGNFACDLRAVLRGASSARTKSGAVAAAGGGVAAAEDQLLAAVQGVKGGFSTSLADDEAALARGGLSPAMQQVVSFRVAMKRCLAQALTSEA